MRTVVVKNLILFKLQYEKRKYKARKKQKWTSRLRKTESQSLTDSKMPETKHYRQRIFYEDRIRNGLIDF